MCLTCGSQHCYTIVLPTLGLFNRLRRFAQNRRRLEVATSGEIPLKFGQCHALLQESIEYATIISSRELTYPAN